MIDRIPEMADFLKPDMEERFQKTLVEIQKEYCRQSMKIDSQLFAAIGEVFSQVKSLQEEGKKGAIKYLLINYLASSLHTIDGKGEKKGWYFRVSALDEGLYLDEQEAESYYCPQFLIPYQESDLLWIYQRLKEQFIRITNFELTEIRVLYIEEYYNSIVLRLFSDLLPEIMDRSGKDGGENSGAIPRVSLVWDIKAIFGRYMEKGILIYQGGGKKSEILSDRNRQE